MALSIVTYALLIATCGLETFAVRRGAMDVSAIPRLASTVLVIRLILGLCCYAIVVCIPFALPRYEPVWALFALYGLSLFTTGASVLWVPQALQLSRPFAAANFGVQFLYLVLVLGALHSGLGLWSIPAAQVAAEAVMGATLLGWMKSKVGNLTRPAPLSEWPALLRQSAPIAGSTLARAIGLGCDLVLLSLFLSASAPVGWYRGAFAIYGLLMASTAIYFVILFPRLVEKRGDSPEAFRHELFNSLRLSVLPATIGAVILGAFAPLVLRLLYFRDPSFQNATLTLQILLATFVVGFLAGHFRYVLLACGRQRSDLGATSFSAASHVLFKLGLIPIFGIEGAAMGTLLGEMTLLIFAFSMVRRDLFPDRPADAVSSRA